MSLAKNVAKNLHDARKQRRFSQETLATRAKVSISYISMLEREQRTPPLATLESLAKALSVSPLDLLREKARPAGKRR